ncbi:MULTISPECIES: flagellar protein FlaG [unclassified Pseudoalteromonas]|uniref:flagellar protein FlaG n=1 Tax=unclassified Pseudoalteromonas TaxID=194690 RepID=UPI0015F8352C|nr:MULTISPECIES: flagellar protein FlaG [unclassified Pseudoalteromonas]MBB1384249.1 flagellar protein FlaG [Pseudoalteromonas sp. SG45-5]MBB1395740.1 flagellar protein FlaG [Pseudoalteromonas sp. SG44-4]MBB1449342.1 flagellar protein FlaG [Pseudoalteromonas sp. SG41-6]
METSNVPSQINIINHKDISNQSANQVSLYNNNGKQNDTVEQAEQTQTASNDDLSPEKLEKVAQQLQTFMSDMNRSLEFHVDEDSGRNVIKVIDKESGDLVKQYPSEEVLQIVSNLAEATGVLVDFKV